jgi:hypothetical protein
LQTPYTRHRSPTKRHPSSATLTHLNPPRMQITHRWTRMIPGACLSSLSQMLYRPSTPRQIGTPRNSSVYLRPPIAHRLLCGRPCHPTGLPYLRHEAVPRRRWAQAALQLLARTVLLWAAVENCRSRQCAKLCEGQARAISVEHDRNHRAPSAWRRRLLTTQRRSESMARRVGLTPVSTAWPERTGGEVVNLRI